MIVNVYAIVTVEVADWHDDPKGAARDLLRDAISREMRPTHDWGNRFAIVPDAPQSLTLSTPDSSD